LTAELPDPDKCPVLFAKVVQHMMHKKCGHHAPPDNDPKPCINDQGECSKYYPYDFVEATQGK
jgi:hypothetical protein